MKSKHWRVHVMIKCIYRRDCFLCVKSSAWCHSIKRTWLLSACFAALTNCVPAYSGASVSFAAAASNCWQMNKIGWAPLLSSICFDFLKMQRKWKSLIFSRPLLGLFWNNPSHMSMIQLESASLWSTVTLRCNLHLLLAQINTSDGPRLLCLCLSAGIWKLNSAAAPLSHSRVLKWQSRWFSS